MLFSSFRMTASQDQGKAVDASFYDEREKKTQLMVHMLARMGADLSSLGPDGDEIEGMEELFKRVACPLYATHRPTLTSSMPLPGADDGARSGGGEGSEHQQTAA